MDNLIELAPLVFSLGVFYSIVLRTFAKSFPALEQHGHRQKAEDGSSQCLLCRFTTNNSLRRWIAGKTRRKEAPDDDNDDADCPNLNIITTKKREDNREKIFFDAYMGQTRDHCAFWRNSPACA